MDDAVAVGESGRPADRTTGWPAALMNAILSIEIAAKQMLSSRY